MAKYSNKALPQILTIAKALAEPNRLRALCALRRRELCVCQITELLRLAPSTVSKHMALLQQARLVESRKEGRWIYYRLARDPDVPVRDALAWAFGTLADAEEIRRDAQSLRQILRRDPQELCRELTRRRRGRRACRSRAPAGTIRRRR